MSVQQLYGLTMAVLIFRFLAVMVQKWNQDARLLYPLPNLITQYFLGRNVYGQGLVYRLNQYVPQIVSNRGIEQMINTFARIDDAIAYAYQKMAIVFTF